MSEPRLSYEEILQIVKVFESSSEFNELHLKYGDIEIDLRKHGASASAAGMQIERQPAPAPHPQAAPASTVAVTPSQAGGTSASAQGVAAGAPAPARPAPAAAPAPAPAAYAANASLVKSPMVGTFYCAPEPGAAPFVKVGQRVTADSTVCIIEVMKLMNSVQAGVSGVVSQILVKDGDAVEFGQVLIVIDPDS